MLVAAARQYVNASDESSWQAAVLDEVCRPHAAAVWPAWRCIRRRVQHEHPQVHTGLMCTLEFCLDKLGPRVCLDFLAVSCVG